MQIGTFGNEEERRSYGEFAIGEKKKEANSVYVQE